MTCPYCHQDAPSIVRGVRAYCTACGAPRSLATAPDAVNVAGQPAQVGGNVAGILGVMALGVGLAAALALGTLAAILFPSAAGLWVGGVIAVLTLVVALPLIFGGRRLRRAGEDRARATSEHAVFALAAQRRGVLTARDVARALSVREEEADALLTSLAKRPEGGVSLEVDDNGAITYRFTDLVPAVAHVRVADQAWQTPVRVAERAQEPRVIDAELIEEEDERRAPSPVRRAVR